jgi:hypothetical protein
MKKVYLVTALVAALIVTTLLLETRCSVAAATSPSPAGIKNVVLVHGAFAEERV